MHKKQRKRQRQIKEESKRQKERAKKDRNYRDRQVERGNELKDTGSQIDYFKGMTIT